MHADTQGQSLPVFGLAALLGFELLPRIRNWPDLLRTGISIREGRLSSVTLLRRLGNHSRRSRLYKALRGLGRVVRTVTLLRYLSEPALRDHITAVTNRTGSFHNYATWLMIGGRLIGHNDPDYQERVYNTRTIRRFGDWVLDLKPPDSSPVTRLDLQRRGEQPCSAA